MVALELHRQKYWSKKWKGLFYCFSLGFLDGKGVLAYSSVPHRQLVVRIGAAVAWPSMQSDFCAVSPPRLGAFS